MRIDVFDVGHGGCAVVTMPNGVRVMLDCGFNSSRPWYPSVAFAGQWIDLLVALNLDEDHLDDLPYLWEKVMIGGIFTDPTVTAWALEKLKRDGMRPGVQKMHQIMPYLNEGRMGSLPIEFGGARGWCYYNQYPHFSDTNNLSLAVFVRYGAFTILFAGDLERAGWRNLLSRPDFVDDLLAVNVLVASHHGRDSGCCADAFAYLRPDIVIFSDCAKQYGSQETVDWYACRATGIPDFSKEPGLFGLQPRRKVLTTRSDGSIQIDVNATGRYEVTPERFQTLPAPHQRSTGLAPPGSLLAALLDQR